MNSWYVNNVMKSLKTLLLRSVLVFGAVVMPTMAGAANTDTTSNQSTDPGWPRERVKDGNRLLVYQPQVDEWKNFQDLSWRMAVSITPKGGKEIVGVVEMKGTTKVDNTAKLVVVSNPQITGTYFPSLDKATADKMEQ